MGLAARLLQGVVAAPTYVTYAAMGTRASSTAGDSCLGAGKSVCQAVRPYATWYNAR